MIYDHYLKYSQSYIDYFTNFIEIRNFGAETDFSKFGFFWKEIQNELLTCSLGRKIISISANTFVIYHLYQKFNFSIFWTLSAFFRNFPLAIISSISCKFIDWQDEQALYNLFQVLTHPGCWDIHVFRWPLNFRNFLQGLGWGHYGPDEYAEQFRL